MIQLDFSLNKWPIPVCKSKSFKKNVFQVNIQTSGNDGLAHLHLKQRVPFPPASKTTLKEKNKERKNEKNIANMSHCNSARSLSVSKEAYSYGFCNHSNPSHLAEIFLTVINSGNHFKIIMYCPGRY